MSLDPGPHAYEGALPLAHWLACVAALPLTATSLAASFQAPLHFRDPSSAVVRGLLGERLRDLRCLTRAPTCEACTETARCDYARIFDAGAGSPEGPSGAKDLHPYWLQGIPADRDLPAGTLHARLVVTGAAAAALPYLDVALRDALARLGEPPRAALTASRIEPVTLSHPPVTARTWRIVAVTPLILRGDLDACARACPRAPWLALLVRAGVRRLDALLRAFSDAPPPPRVTLPPLEEVEVLAGGFEPWRGSRFSRRQGQRFPLDGLVGRAVVRGEALRALGGLLEALAVTSVGKATTMGFGQLGVEAIE